ncbi:nucleotidyltransferase domain-containing protein [Candidatus Woesearchaeota archaeon]|nr:nucleotidyltransferase domain-containing protein [Candidatus Woesearchaeota archaeon]
MKNLVKKLRKLLSKEILDIVIFGSLPKGKLYPDDIDIAVITDSPGDVKEKIKTIEGKADIQIVGLAKYSSFLMVTILREGYSTKHNEYLHKILGLKPCVLYKYSLKELSNVKKVMFDRAIKNFDNITKLSNRVVLVPVEISNEFSDFLRGWKLDIDTDEYYLMPLVRKNQ